MSPLRRRLCIAALLAAPCWRTASAQATRPLRLVVPYAPGGVIDAIARQIAEPLARLLGDTVLVENLPGAGGSLGLQQLLADAGGPRLGVAIATDSDLLLVPLFNPGVRYRAGDFRLLGLIGSGPMVLVRSARYPDPPWPALAPRPRGTEAPSVSFGNYGVDSNAHLIAEEFADRTGLGAVHLPYKGIAPLLQDLGGGHVDLAFLPLAGLAAQMADGRLAPVAVAARERHPLLPRVATVEEVFGLRDFHHSSWAGLVMPRSVPLAVASRHAEALQGALADAATRSRLQASGVTLASPMSLDDAQHHLDRSLATYQRLATAAGRRAPARRE